MKPLDEGHVAGEFVRLVIAGQEGKRELRVGRQIGEGGRRLSSEEWALAA